MPRQESSISIHDWIEEETRHIDIVASWENLCDTYSTLRFSDPLSDAERLEEYKWIVQQMNSFLTKMKTKLTTCKNLESMVELLTESFNPSGKIELSARKALVYQKLRQQWIRTTIMKLHTMILEEEQNGEDE